MTDLERARRYFVNALNHPVLYRLFTKIPGREVKQVLLTAQRLARNGESWETIIRNSIGAHPNSNLDGKHLDFIFYSRENSDVRRFYDVAIWDAGECILGDKLSELVNIQVLGTNIRFFFIQISKDADKWDVLHIYDHRKLAYTNVPEEPKTGLG